MATPKTADDFITKQTRWKEPLVKFREILLSAELEENIKWGQPVYSFKGKNVVGMGAFKSYVELLFFQGVFLKDPNKVLVNAQDGKTKALRQLRFSSTKEMDYNLVKSYINEAIQNQKTGKELPPESNKPLIIPIEFQSVLDADPTLKSSFESYPPGKPREFTSYVSEAKQEKTRHKRVEKIIPLTKDGIGLNDKYRK